MAKRLNVIAYGGAVRLARTPIDRTVEKKGRLLSLIELHLAGGSPPPPGSPSSVRRWLADAIAEGVVSGCGSCAPQQPCPVHAADAVITACRQDRLFIMPAADADAIIELAVDRRLEELAQVPLRT